jgi:hypothetical protein
MVTSGILYIHDLFVSAETHHSIVLIDILVVLEHEQLGYIENKILRDGVLGDNVNLLKKVLLLVCQVNSIFTQCTPQLIHTN